MKNNENYKIGKRKNKKKENTNSSSGLFLLKLYKTSFKPFFHKV